MRAELLLTVDNGEGVEAVKAQRCFYAAQAACRNLNLSHIKQVHPDSCSLRIEGPIELIQRIFVGLTAEFDLEYIQ